MKENFVFRLPPEIYFGGEKAKSWRISKRWGEKALLVTGKIDARNRDIGRNS